MTSVTKTKAELDLWWKNLIEGAEEAKKKRIECGEGYLSLSLKGPSIGMKFEVSQETWEGILSHFRKLPKRNWIEIRHTGFGLRNYLSDSIQKEEPALFIGIKKIEEIEGLELQIIRGQKLKNNSSGYSEANSSWDSDACDITLLGDEEQRKKASVVVSNLFPKDVLSIVFDYIPFLSPKLDTETVSDSLTLSAPDVRKSEAVRDLVEVFEKARDRSLQREQ